MGCIVNNHRCTSFRLYQLFVRLWPLREHIIKVRKSVCTCAVVAREIVLKFGFKVFTICSPKKGTISGKKPNATMPKTKSLDDQLFSFDNQGIQVPQAGIEPALPLLETGF